MGVNVITLGPGKLTIGAVADLTNFSGQTKACKLVPSVNKGDQIHVLSGETVSGDRTESFTLEGTLLQDLGVVKSTTEWLFTHRGESHPFEFIPSTAAGKAITGTLEVEAIEIGGDVNSKPTSDFKFDLVGAPKIAAPAAG